MARRSTASVSSLVQACGANGQHARVEPAAAAGARLEQDVGEARRQAPVELVRPEDVAVEHLPLALGRQAAP